MRTLRIQGYTRYLGRPIGWEPKEQGHCGNLAVRDNDTSAGPGMTSAWEILPEELERLKAGAPILLTVLGTVHPPVAISVGTSPDESLPTPAAEGKV